jgi:hypothetical protein
MKIITAAARDKIAKKNSESGFFRLQYCVSERKKLLKGSGVNIRE